MGVEPMSGSGRPGKPGEVLVAILNRPKDLGILRDQGWYRVPVKSTPRGWPPQAVAFYLTSKFEDQRFTIPFYGRVRGIERKLRRELLPDEPLHPHADLEYYQVRLDDLLVRDQPIVSRRGRRIVFIPTTWAKFESAQEINELFADSPLEETLWLELKRQGMQAERQWEVVTRNGRFKLDFALFCRKDAIDVETDGTSWHANPEAALKDATRDNALTVGGWRILRFHPHRVQQEMQSYCISHITRLITHLDGLSDEGLVSRRFYDTRQGLVQQLSLLEESGQYALGPPEDELED